jgi:hypothetical protein
MGIPPENVMEENFSLDTIGNVSYIHHYIINKVINNIYVLLLTKHLGLFSTYGAYFTTDYL